MELVVEPELKIRVVLEVQLGVGMGLGVLGWGCWDGAGGVA